MKNKFSLLMILLGMLVLLMVHMASGCVRQAVVTVQYKAVIRKVEPVGKFIRLRFEQISNGRPLTKTGLMPGDTITVLRDQTIRQ